MLVNSSFYQKAHNGTSFPDWKHTMGDVDVPLVILRNPACPLLPWLIKPYLDNMNTSSQEHNFNFQQIWATMVVENAFGQLKWRWKCLLKRINSHISHGPNIVGVCVVLHNMCEIHVYGDHCLREWMVDVPTHMQVCLSVYCSNHNLH